MQFDEPKYRFSIRQNQLPNVRLLLHAPARAAHEAVVAAALSEDRYDYGRRTRPVRDHARRRHLADAEGVRIRKLHFAQGGCNAIMLKAPLGEPLLPGLVDRYP